jgi:hypothetical protein
VVVELKLQCLHVLIITKSPCKGEALNPLFSVKMVWLVFGGYIKFLAIAASFLLEIIVLNAQYIR